MLWVDQESYFGPDRRRAMALRLRERRRQNMAANPPSLNIALRQLRMRVLDARGSGLGRFVDRVHGTAALAEFFNESDTAHELSLLGMRMMSHSEKDMRPQAYTALDRAHAALSAYH